MKFRYIRINKAFLCASIFFIPLVACERNVEEVNTEDEDLEGEVEKVYALEEHEEASDYSWDDSDIIPVILSGSSISSEGSGLTIEGSTVTLTSAGTYRFSGSLSDGQIVVDSEEEEMVRIILAGVSLSNSSTAPLYIKNASKVILVLEEGTENIVRDASFYNSDEDGPNAAIFSSDNLTIFGEGSLRVYGNYNDGICSKDGLIIKSGFISVNAIDDGIRGKDYLVIKDGDILIDALGDGLKSDLDEVSELGYITIESGTVKISSLAKGIKAENGITIFSGTINIDADDDAIHSNGDITIDGGVFSLASGDDAIHADLNLVINRGEIDITEAYEGIESAEGNITINDGVIHLLCSDDGINLAAGGDSQGGRPKSTESTTDSYLFQINGAYISANTGGDGLDSNDDFEMNGGIVIVSGSSQNSNCALDVNGSLIVDAGFLVAAGTANMAQAPESSSEQNGALITFRSTQSAGTLAHIEDQDGNEILNFEPPKSFDSMAFSSSALVNGSTYTIYLGGSHSGTAVDGIYEDGTYTSGTKYSSFTVAESISYVN